MTDHMTPAGSCSSAEAGGNGDTWNWVINTQAQGHFRLDGTFKVLFILYIQYTSQKYRVNLQQRASTHPIKSDL